MKFEYKARDQEGNAREGEIEADSKGQALLNLQQKDLYVLSLDEKKVPFYERKVDFDLSFLERVKDQDLVMFCRQLGIMLGSQIGIVESLRILNKQIEKKTLRKKIEDVADRIEEGETFSGALSKHDDVFSRFFVGVIKSGEASGKLPESLEYLEKNIKRRSEFKSKLVGALIYPLFIVFVFSFVVTFLLIFVIPDMVEMIEELDQEIPFITQMVISISDFVVNWGIFVLGGIIAFFAGLFRIIKTDKGKKTFDNILFKIPLIGELTKKINLAYFSESMSTLISSGLDIVESLEITEDIISNTVYERIVGETGKAVKEGKNISSALRKHPNYFPALVVQMLIVGERTGKMEKVLSSITEFYQNETDRTLDNFVKIAEPLLIILLGFLVGGLVVSVILPIYDMGMGMA